MAYYQKKLDDRLPCFIYFYLMPTIYLKTQIHSTIQICFDLSRSIDLHQISTAASKEKAIAGRTTGLIYLGETVTWEATHFGIRQQLTSKITAFNRPHHFRDEQIKGAFKSFVHDHSFSTVGDAVVMEDVFTFQSPFGIIGKIVNKLFLTGYMTKLLKERNRVIKDYAETGKWNSVIGAENFRI